MVIQFDSPNFVKNKGDSVVALYRLVCYNYCIQNLVLNTKLTEAKRLRGKL